MEISELQIGTKLELELRDEEGKKLDQSLISEFEWLVDPKTLMIAAPIHEGEIYPLRNGTIINIYFVHKAGKEYELYSFNAIISGREMSEKIALLKIGVISEIERIQRRQYYRLGCSMPVKFRVVESMSEIVNGSIPFRKTIASNLSGGGICLLLEDRLEVGKLVECEIATEENKEVRFFGKVIRYDNSQLDGRFKYEAGIAYIKINNNDREAVVKYIFNEQRKLRKKGLI